MHGCGADDHQGKTPKASAPAKDGGLVAMPSRHQPASVADCSLHRQDLLSNEAHATFALKGSARKPTGCSAMQMHAIGNYSKVCPASVLPYSSVTGIAARLIIQVVHPDEAGEQLASCSTASML